MEAAAQVCTEGGAAEWWGTRTVDAFDKLAVIGAGTYGYVGGGRPSLLALSAAHCSKVYKARDRVTGEYVALKLCKFDERKVMQNGVRARERARPVRVANANAAATARSRPQLCEKSSCCRSCSIQILCGSRRW